jgi:hypothetical protein
MTQTTTDAAKPVQEPGEAGLAKRPGCLSVAQTGSALRFC